MDNNINNFNNILREGLYCFCIMYLPINLIGLVLYSIFIIIYYENAQYNNILYTLYILR